MNSGLRAEEEIPGVARKKLAYLRQQAGIACLQSTPEILS
jgi:hypothetical protein